MGVRKRINTYLYAIVKAVIIADHPFFGRTVHTRPAADDSGSGQCFAVRNVFFCKRTDIQPLKFRSFVVKTYTVSLLDAVLSFMMLGQPPCMVSVKMRYDDIAVSVQTVKEFKRFGCTSDIIYIRAAVAAHNADISRKRFLACRYI